MHNYFVKHEAKMDFCNQFLWFVPVSLFTGTSLDNLIPMVLNVKKKNEKMETVIRQIYVLNVLSLTPRTNSALSVVLEGRDRRRLVNGAL